MGKDRALAMFADWTTRIAAGELPPAPPRPQGAERNVVITEMGLGDGRKHICTTRSPPTSAIRRSTPTGRSTASPELSTDNIPVLDPVHFTTSTVTMPVRDPKTPGPGKPLQASAYWGDEAIWDSQANMHNPMFDEKGRVWFTSRDPAAGESGLLQGGFEPPVGEAVSAEPQRAATGRCTTRRPSSSR